MFIQFNKFDFRNNVMLQLVGIIDELDTEQYVV